MQVKTDPEVYLAPEEKEQKVAVKNKKYSRRFKVINEERNARQNFNYNNWQGSYKAKGVNVPISLQTENSGMYSFYSPSTTEPMHKLKLSGLAK